MGNFNDTNILHAFTKSSGESNYLKNKTKPQHIYSFFIRYILLHALRNKMNNSKYKNSSMCRYVVEDCFWIVFFMSFLIFSKPFNSLFHSLIIFLYILSHCGFCLKILYLINIFSFLLGFKNLSL